MINVFDSAKILCQSAMEIFIGLAKKNIAQKGSFAVALSGGSTPNLMYDLLSQKENTKRINWEKLFIFWGDERYISYNSKDNNAFQAKSHLLDLVPIPQNNIFRIPVSGDYRNDALHYEEGIKKFFNANLPHFDLIFLGLGEEGHTASIFPGSELLQENDALVKDVYVTTKKMQRISFTPMLINAAKEIVFIVAGKSKSAAVKEVLEGKFQPEIFPAQIIKPVEGSITWLLDKDAASQLSQQKKHKKNASII
ncbi:MAG TPA: 6-phosphogluconolactonase [Ferruginibacter sp.]|nr:6-phosphogluconolactonase [Ferruginibacter sp.]HQV43464.1 6-phosphogluconolactonase [Ferruginibacter sp.]